MGNIPDFSTELLSTSVIRPSKSDLNYEIITEPLSIIDSLVANYSPAGAVMFFSSPSANELTTRSLLPNKLKASLSACLNSYPRFGGYLHFIDPANSWCLPYQRRYGRLAVTYGSSDETKTPGIQFVEATTATPLASILHSSKSHPSGLRTSLLPDPIAFFPPTSSHPIACNDLKPSDPKAPATIIQHTTYPCGCISLAVKIAHPLADTQTLFTFIQAWAAKHQSMFGSNPGQTQIPPPPSHLSAHQLDTAAEGDLNSPAGPEPNLVSISRSLPVTRFSWWKKSPHGDCPWSSYAAKIPEELQPWKNDDGDPLPWLEWDVSKKVEFRAIHFSPEEVERVFHDAIAKGHKDQSAVTHHTALVAYAWQLIARARDALQWRHSCSTTATSPTDSSAPPHDTNKKSEGNSSLPLSHLHLTLGLRPRLSPPLPASFLGSPIFTSTTTTPVSNLLSASSLPSTALLIQNSTAQFRSEKLGALLHDLAYEPCLWRLWHCFLGSNRVLLSSWVRSGVWDVDFSGRENEGGQKGEQMVGVLPLMPSCDGLLVVVESSGTQKREKHDRKEKRKAEKGKWWEDGVDVACFLEEATWREMEMLN